MFKKILMKEKSYILFWSENVNIEICMSAKYTLKYV